jgi:ACR3 family arsenite transporter
VPSSSSSGSDAGRSPRGSHAGGSNPYGHSRASLLHPGPVVSAVESWLERRQIGLYLMAILSASVVGVTVPRAHRLEGAIEPVLALLLFATFLGVPFAAIRKSLRDGRFLAAVGVLNFIVVPLVAYGLSRFVADEPALLFGVLMVLLTPCIDYVIVFAGLAGGASERLLAAAPLLMLAQILLLPLYLLLFIGPEGVAVVEVGPFARAFLLLIVVPLTAAAVVQALARRHRSGVVIERAMLGVMVPLMVATLFTVVASQAGAVGDSLTQLLVLVPIYAAFLVVMAALGIGAGRIVQLDLPATRALVFSGATRNSLVVLPLALALPASLSLAPVVVVTQTLVELVGMVIFVRLIPRLVPSQRGPIGSEDAKPVSR